MLRRKFIQTALSGLAALGLAAVAKSPDEVEVPILNLDLDGGLDIYSDNIISLKSTDVSSSEIVESGTYAAPIKRTATESRLLTINATGETRWIIDAEGNTHFPPFEVQ